MSILSHESLLLIASIRALRVHASYVLQTTKHEPEPKPHRGGDAAGHKTLKERAAAKGSQARFHLHSVHAGSPTSHLEAAVQTQSSHGSGDSSSGALQEGKSVDPAIDREAPATEVSGLLPIRSSLSCS